MLEQIENIRTLVAKGKTEDAIKLLLSLLESGYTELRNQVLVLSSRLGNENRNRRLGIDEDKNEIVKVNLSILEIADELENKIMDRIKNVQIELHDNQKESKEKEFSKKYTSENRALIEEIKDRILISLIGAKVDLTKIRVKILNENFQLWEVVIHEDRKHLSNDEDTLSRVFYLFYENQLNVMNFSWKNESISMHVYIKNGRIGFFEQEKE